MHSIIFSNWYALSWQQRNIELNITVKANTMFPDDISQAQNVKREKQWS